MSGLGSVIAQHGIEGRAWRDHEVSSAMTGSLHALGDDWQPS